MNEIDALEQAEYRIAVSLKACRLLRAAIERNGNLYDGGLVPNLTTVTDILTIPFDMLVTAVEKNPELRPE